jgi:hypothetical protein
MRPVAFFLIGLGLWFFVDAGRDEWREIAEAISPRGGETMVIPKADDPEQFRNLMVYQWWRGVVVLIAGMVILGIVRRADRLDPFSPDFRGSNALDELDQSLKEQERRHRRPFKE